MFIFSQQSTQNVFYKKTNNLNNGNEAEIKYKIKYKLYMKICPN